MTGEHVSAAEAPDTSRGSDPRVTVAALASLVAAGIGAVYWLSRVGFVNPAAPVLKSVALAFFFIDVPLCASWLIRGTGPRWIRSYSFLALATLALLGLVGRTVPLTGLNPMLLLGAAGVAAFLVVFARWISNTKWWRIPLFLAGSGVFAVWASGVVWGRVYKSPLFLEMMSYNGVVHHDGLAVAALGNMLQAYRVASVGLDGLVYMAYHWGTPWLFAQLSNMLEISVLDFYQLTFPVMMIPFFFGGVVAFAVEVGAGNRSDAPRPAASHRTWLFWALFLAATIGVVPVTAMDALGVWTSNLLISESYTVAVPAGLLLLAVTILFWRDRGSRILESGSADRSTLVFLVLVLGPGVIALGYLKISVMILAFILIIYFGLRLQLYKRPLFVAFGVVLAGLVAHTYTRVSLPEHREGLSPLDFMQSYVPPAWWPFFPLLHVFWSLLYSVLRIRQERLATVGDVIGAAKARRIFDVEAVALVALAGLGPGMILHINGGSAFYFSDVQRWLAVGLLLSRLPSFMRETVEQQDQQRASPPPGSRSGWQRLTLGRAGFVLVCIPLAITLVLNAAYWPRRMFHANAETRAGLYTLALGDTVHARIAALPHLTNDSILAAGLRLGRNTAVVRELVRLGQLPLSERRTTALFIPQNQLRYWNLLTRPRACTFDPHVAPALAAMVMIDGMPPPECELIPYYGVGAYTRRARPQLPSDVTPEALCSRARRWGRTRVMELQFPDAAPMSRVIHQCR